MACPLFTPTFVTAKRNNELVNISNKEIRLTDYILGFSNKPTLKKVFELFEVKIPLSRQRKVVLDNGIELICSDNHALICTIDGEYFDIFPDDLTDTHNVITTMGISHVKHVLLMDDDTLSQRFLDIIVEDSYYFCGSNPEKGLVLCYN